MLHEHPDNKEAIDNTYQLGMGYTIKYMKKEILMMMLVTTALFICGGWA